MVAHSSHRGMVFLAISLAILFHGFLIPATILSQDRFTLGFSGPDELAGPAGSTQRATYYCTLTHAGIGPGARSWQFAVGTKGGGISTISLKGSEILRLFRESCIEDHLDLATGIGNVGAVSRVSLDPLCGKDLSLPANRAVTVARLEVRALIPPEDGSMVLGYVKGLEIGDRAIGNRVTQEDRLILPGFLEKSISLRAIEPVPPFIRGDCDGDGRALGDISEPIMYLDWLFAVGPDPACKAACDVNGDGSLDVSDAVYSLLYLFRAGRAPVAPFPECGPGTAIDELLTCKRPGACARGDLVLSSVSLYDSDLDGTQVVPEELYIRKGHHARFLVSVDLLYNDPAMPEAFDYSGATVVIIGRLIKATAPSSPTEEESFVVEASLEREREHTMSIHYNEKRRLFQSNDVHEAGLFYTDTLVMIPTGWERDDHELYTHKYDRDHPPNLLGDNPHLRDVLIEELPVNVAFIQHAYNNHNDPQPAYQLDFIGTLPVSTVIFTLDVNVDRLRPGFYLLEVRVDPSNEIEETEELNNSTLVPNFQVDEFESTDFQIVEAVLVDEAMRHFTCLDEDPAPSVKQPATYIYEAYCEGGGYWTNHSESLSWNGVDDNTADEIVIGEVWGPFGTGCYDYTDREGPSGSCTEWVYRSSTSVTCDVPGTCWAEYDQACDPEDTLGYEECVAGLKHFSGRPNPTEIKNVMVFFPGTLGANGGSVFTGQIGWQGTQNDFDGDNNKLLRPFKKTSLMGRIVIGREDFGEHPDCPYDRHACGETSCGNCFTRENTLLIGVWDCAIDTTETKDREIIEGLEEIIALRTNLYENVERIWIVGGSRGGSTAIYLMSKIVGRFKGTFEPRVPGAGRACFNRIYNSGLDRDGNSRSEGDLRFVVAGIPPHSMTNDPDSHYRRLVNYYWGRYNPPGAWNFFSEAGHANGHDFVALFSQSGRDLWAAWDHHTPALAVFSVADKSGYDPMLHVRGDNHEDELKARFPVSTNWPWCNWDTREDGHPASTNCNFWVPELDSYIHPWNGPHFEGDVGNFFNVLWPLRQEDGSWRRYRHSELTRDWTPFHRKFSDFMFSILFGMDFNGGDPRLPPEVICSNMGNIEFGCYDMQDNDHDGDVDCDDSDCFGFYMCD